VEGVKLELFQQSYQVLEVPLLNLSSCLQREIRWCR
jgi:hypothetical protein